MWEGLFSFLFMGHRKRVILEFGPSSVLVPS